MTECVLMCFTISMNILEEANLITSVDRNLQYGEPDVNFGRTAEYWNVYLKQKQETEHTQKLDSQDVAMFMIFLKIARLANKYQRDGCVDIAGYIRLYSMIEGDDNRE